MRGLLISAFVSGRAAGEFRWALARWRMAMSWSRAWQITIV